MMPYNRDDGRSVIVLLSGAELRAILHPAAAIEALREAYAALADSRSDVGRSVGFSVDGGSIHVKSGLLPGSRAAFASKVNVNLPDNRRRRRLPTIQGVVVLADPVTGRPLAVMESIALTGLRTAAAAALAAQYGARRDTRRAAIIGCGVQAGYQLAALQTVFALQEVSVFDSDRSRAETFAATSTSAGCRVTAAATLAQAIGGADICVTCTTSTTPILTDDMDLRGRFIAAIGADSAGKQEIDPALMRRARILVDDLDACASGGDLAHALKGGAVSRDGVHADLADLAAGRRPGRLSPDEVVIYDSTGSGVQDVAAAWAAYREAVRTGRGMTFDLAGREPATS